MHHPWCSPALPPGTRKQAGKIITESSHRPFLGLLLFKMLQKPLYQNYQTQEQFLPLYYHHQKNLTSIICCSSIFFFFFYQIVTTPSYLQTLYHTHTHTHIFFIYNLYCLLSVNMMHIVCILSSVFENH